MFTIRVLYESNGQPARDVAVFVSNSALFGWSRQGKTDDNGEVDFDLNPTNKGTVTVDPGFFSKTKHNVYEGPLKGRITVYV